MTRKEIFDIMRQRKDTNINEQLEFVEVVLLSSVCCSEAQKKEIRHKFSYVKSEFKRRWTDAHYKEDIFRKKNHDWLQGTFELPKTTIQSGRPSKTFEESSERSKRRKTEELHKTAESEELIFAAQMELRSKGKTDASRILKEITSSPKQATKYKRSY